MLAVLHLLLGVVAISFTAHPSGTMVRAPVLAVEMSYHFCPVVSGCFMSVINDQQLCLDVDAYQNYHPEPPER